MLLWVYLRAIKPRKPPTVTAAIRDIRTSTANVTTIVLKIK
jgi:hypothetical protein